MKVTLNNGHKMPLLIYGTYKVFPDIVPSCLQAALDAGFRHIDTASMYGNEEAIGSYLKNSAYARDSIFLTTKVWPSQYRDIRTACEESLQRLQTDYIDLYLLHWPIALKSTGPGIPVYNPSPNNFENIDRYPLHLAWQQMEELVKLGKVRSIGVSNWNVGLLNDMLSYATIPPACNQFETHIFNPKHKLVEFCLRNNVIPLGYRVVFSPPNEPRYTFKGSTNDHPLVKEFAVKYGKSTYQILIRWNLQRKSGVVVKSANPIRIQENWDAQNFTISDQDMEFLNNLEVYGVFSDSYSMFGMNIE